MSENLPKRKSPRLKEYDYNDTAVYFITICVQNRKCLLSNVVGTGVLDCPRIELTEYGRISEKYIKQLNDFYFKATIYFAPIPFYLPLAAFSSKNAHSLWLLLLVSVPQFTFIGMGISELSKNVKADKQKQEQHEKERKEQERRESMGKWK